MRRLAFVLCGLLIGCGSTSSVDTSNDAADATIEPDVRADTSAPFDTGISGDSRDAADVSADAPMRVYGVTTDSIDAIDDIVASLAALPHRPTTRIVFDEVPANTYIDAAKKIHAVSDVMGELCDSFYMKDFTNDAYFARIDEYLSTLNGDVDVWEVGNEINGDWLGDTASVVAKMTGTFDRVRKISGKTALTLYWFEPTCLPDAQHEMFTWVDANAPAEMKSGLDWVLISYYEEDCGGARPDWPTIFHRLATAFPNSKIGFGEVGIKDPPSKADYLNRYYGLTIDEPRWIAGDFWWYFHQDMVPKTQPLWSVLAAAMAAEP